MGALAAVVEHGDKFMDAAEEGVEKVHELLGSVEPEDVSVTPAGAGQVAPGVPVAATPTSTVPPTAAGATPGPVGPAGAPVQGIAAQPAVQVDSSWADREAAQQAQINSQQAEIDQLRADLAQAQRATVTSDPVDPVTPVPTSVDAPPPSPPADTSPTSDVPPAGTPATDPTIAEPPPPAPEGN